jgi:hypothetical protein
MINKKDREAFVASYCKLQIEEASKLVIGAKRCYNLTWKRERKYEDI